VSEVKRHGRDVFAICPFHLEKTPSCKVDDDKGLFYCFGCGASGDAIAFIRIRYNCSFKEAVERLASMAGIGVDCRRRGSFSYKPSKAELAERMRHLEAARQEQQVEQERRWEAAAEEALRIWDESVPISGQGHPYLKAKGVDAFGLRRTVEDYEFGRLHVPAGSLVVPLCDENSKLWSLQFYPPVYPPRKKADKSKWPRFFMSGGRIEGRSHILGVESEHILLCEGYATAASIHEATGERTVVCFSSGNMAAVASALRRKYPAKEIIICADADEAGLKTAKEAGDAVGAYAIWPEFPSDTVAAHKSSGDSTDGGRLTFSSEKAPNDFNDLHCICGLEAVRKQISNLTNYLRERTCQK
jgi:putative DNA primase/helicase